MKDEPPYEIQIEGETKHRDIISKERALLKAQDLVAKDSSRKIEVFDWKGMRVFVSDVHSPRN